MPIDGLPLLYVRTTTISFLLTSCEAHVSNPDNDPLKNRSMLCKDRWNSVPLLTTASEMDNYVSRWNKGLVQIDFTNSSTFFAPFAHPSWKAFYLQYTYLYDGIHGNSLGFYSPVCSFCIQAHGYVILSAPNVTVVGPLMNMSPEDTEGLRKQLLRFGAPVL